jgi:hypothetical protein
MYLPGKFNHRLPLQAPIFVYPASYLEALQLDPFGTTFLIRARRARTMERTIPKIHLQPPSVDFIDTQLPRYHEAFRNTQAHFDLTVGRYVASDGNTHNNDGDDDDHDDNNSTNMMVASALVPNPASAPLPPRHGHLNSTDSDSTSDDSDNGPGGSLAPRQLPPKATAMKFWSFIFNGALRKFKEEHGQPERRPDMYDIRNTANWDAVYERLQQASKVYDGTTKGFWGRSKRARRRVTDYASPARGLVKFVPEGTFTSPVRAAIEVLLDVGCHSRSISALKCVARAK